MTAYKSRPHFKALVHTHTIFAYLVHKARQRNGMLRISNVRNKARFGALEMAIARLSRFVDVTA